MLYMQNSTVGTISTTPPIVFILHVQHNLPCFNLYIYMYNTSTKDPGLMAGDQLTELQPS